MTTKERTLRFIAHKGLSIKKFEEMCSLSNGYLNSMKSGYGNSKLAKVLAAFPELNRDWLVYGEGEMLKEEAGQPANTREPSTLVGADDNALIAELRAQIEKLEAKVDNLNQELGEKNALLRMFRQGGVESV